jgi:hypothetical protein
LGVGGQALGCLREALARWGLAVFAAWVWGFGAGAEQQSIVLADAHDQVQALWELRVEIGCWTACVGHRQQGFLLAGAHGDLALSGFERFCGSSQCL